MSERDGQHTPTHQTTQHNTQHANINTHTNTITHGYIQNTAQPLAAHSIASYICRAACARTQTCTCLRSASYLTDADTDQSVAIHRFIPSHKTQHCDHSCLLVQSQRGLRSHWNRRQAGVWCCPQPAPPSIYLPLSLPPHSSSHVGCRSALKTRPCSKGQSCAGKEGARRTRPRSQWAGTNKRCHCIAGRHTRGRANG